MEDKHIIFIPKCQIHMEPVTPISTWPTETIEGESETPKVFRHKVTFSFKIPKMKQKICFKKPKLPRKLKKALKHLYVGFPHEKIEQAPVGYSIVMLEPLGTKEGYPRTKWIRKAEKHIRKQFVVIQKSNPKQQ